jgi:hypothetical protein
MWELRSLHLTNRPCFRHSPAARVKIRALISRIDNGKHEFIHRAKHALLKAVVVGRFHDGIIRAMRNIVSSVDQLVETLILFSHAIFREAESAGGFAAELSSQGYTQY